MKFEDVVATPGSLARAALDYARRGLPVFPVEPGGKKPLTENGFKDATLDSEVICGWWAATPQANIGMPTAGYLVVDLDLRRGPDGLSGPERWDDLAEAHGGHEPTRTQQTGSGGRQVFFLDPEGRFRNTAAKLGHGIDTRANGGYVVLPPSVHPTGGRYRWEHEAQCVPVPPWLAGLLTPPPRAPVGEARPLPAGADATAYGEAALLGIAEEMRQTPEGRRNDTLNALAYRAGRLVAGGEFRDDLAEAELTEAALAAGLEPDEALATFRNGFTAGTEAGPAQRREPATKATKATKAFPSQKSGSVTGRRDPLVASVASVADPLVASVAYVAPPIRPRPEAFSGLAGEIVEAIEPHTEADPTGVLGSLLICFGNAAGRRPYVAIGRAHHGTNLQGVLVGDTSLARKGTATAEAKWMLRLADEEWALQKVVNGLVSGEGVIHHVRDRVTKLDDEDNEKVVDEGVSDKRLMCIEPEYGRVLTAGGRQGSTLLHVLRQAWDRDLLSNLTRHSPEKATDAHVSTLGHITSAELLDNLTETERANGFANRILWLHVRRTRELPFGGEVPQEEATKLADKLRQALEKARDTSLVGWDGEAMDLWAEHYPILTRERPGLVGAILSRAEAQTLRLALIYALVDGRRVIEAKDIKAALALWDYAERSVSYVFGGRIGNPFADAVLLKLRRSPQGVSRTEIRDLFSRHARAAEVEQGLSLLEEAGLARRGTEESGGRPTELWFVATEATEATEGSDA